MVFTIDGKQYELTKASIYISELYGDYVRSRNAGITVDAEIEQAKIACEIEREEADSKSAKLKADLKLFKEARRIRAESLEKLKGAQELQRAVLKEIVELNGYEFDVNAWVHSIDEDAFNSLIEDILVKKKAKDQE